MSGKLIAQVICERNLLFRMDELDSYLSSLPEMSEQDTKYVARFIAELQKLTKSERNILKTLKDGMYLSEILEKYKPKKPKYRVGHKVKAANLEFTVENVKKNERILYDLKRWDGVMCYDIHEETIQGFVVSPLKPIDSVSPGHRFLFEERVYIKQNTSDGCFCLTSSGFSTVLPTGTVVDDLGPLDAKVWC